MFAQISRGQAVACCHLRIDQNGCGREIKTQLVSRVVAGVLRCARCASEGDSGRVVDDLSGGWQSDVNVTSAASH